MKGGRAQLMLPQSFTDAEDDTQGCGESCASYLGNKYISLLREVDRGILLASHSHSLASYVLSLIPYSPRNITVSQDLLRLPFIPPFCIMYLLALPVLQILAVNKHIKQPLSQILVFLMAYCGPIMAIRYCDSIVTLGSSSS